MTPTDPTNHRLVAEQLTARVYRDTGDPQALATLAVAHALLATPPAVPKGSERLSTAASSLLLLALVALVCGSVVAVAWLVAT